MVHKHLYAASCIFERDPNHFFIISGSLYVDGYEELLEEGRKVEIFCISETNKDNLDEFGKENYKTDLPPMKLARYGHAMSVLKDIVYVFGGKVSSNEPYLENTIEKLNLLALHEGWIQLKIWNGPFQLLNRINLASVIIDEHKVVILGGETVKPNLACGF